MARAQPLARADHHLAALGIELDHVEWLSCRHANPAPLTDRIVDDAVMPAEHVPVNMDDVARLRGARAQALDDLRVAPRRDEADGLRSEERRVGKGTTRGGWELL